ncbi:MAG: hypothetical protein COY69_02635 [Candidatus Magasanikbacteria bacterium CG_4_10_14_0_8_um_filter_32_14]|uniref:Type 4 fimbrial biogenesis protein PilX N-terminal domain-containing protein n=2 Tax=Candidatus Magasanikiibacteriota TaxID=1752731 RepID=A0A2M7R933_9BACT|nr:MAG: hypothetical protein AUJ23_00700 [Candidatus Magasanikbacteria bacterium CG1_02_32_51]PIY93250.1 MAG: hypothetical protein COY69_02635 [Candidatus Magasanikbacteria bacterium CG_4_10_14_0_8_um_filter_32_14]
MLATNNRKKIRNNHQGLTLIFVMVFGFVAFVTITLGIVSYSIFQSSTIKYLYRRDLSFHLAEAGIDYYHWHLIQFPEDYTDGTGNPPPYVHNYYDKNGNLVGRFSLDIVAPVDGTHVVGVRSTGTIVDSSGDTISSPRTIETYFGYESFSDSAFVMGSDVIFSSTTVVYGKVFSNGCIEFDGVSDNFVQSAKTMPQCPTQTGGNGGVFGTGGPTNFWRYPVPYKDFPAMSTYFSDLYDMSITSDGRFLSAQSSSKGWHLVFLSNGTYNTYKVKTFSNTKYNINQEIFVDNQAIPVNGVIYSNSNIFVEGVVNGRVTVVSDGNHTLIINNNITYFQKYSDDVLGLMSYGDVKIAYDVPTNMEINAVMLSINGKVGRDYYGGHPGTDKRDSLLFFGSIISYAGSGFKYLNDGEIVSGFVNTTYIYDGNLLYQPSIGVPVIPQYRLISWKELK